MPDPQHYDAITHGGYSPIIPVKGLAVSVMTSQENTYKWYIIIRKKTCVTIDLQLHNVLHSKASQRQKLKSTPYTTT